MGHYSEQGWWHYFPVAFLVKTPGGTLVLTGVALLLATVLFRVRLRQRRSGSLLRRWISILRALPFAAWWLSVPLVYYFATSLTSHINLGVRHLLPIYPFLFALLGWLVTIRLTRYTRAFRYVVWSLAFRRH